MSDACGFRGHADAPKELYVPLRNSIEQPICQQDAREFYVGSQGAFDRMALRALREMKASGFSLTLKPMDNSGYFFR